MADVIPALGGCEERECGGDQSVDLIECARPRRPEEGFQFREGLLDRVEVGAVGRKESYKGAHGLDRSEHVRLFVHRQIVEHHYVPGSQRRHEDLVDIGEERRGIDRPVEHRGRAEPLKPQRGDHRVRLPMATRGVIMEPDAAGTPAITSQQIGRHAAFVEKHVLTDIAQRLPQAPVPPGRGDISAALFLGVYRFF